MWFMVYWSTFFITYIVIPLAQEYVAAGKKLILYLYIFVCIARDISLHLPCNYLVHKLS